MKPICSISALLLLAVSHTSAQGPFRRHHDNYHLKTHVSAVPIIGGCAMGVGAGMFVVGGFIWVATEGGSTGNAGAGVALAGAGIFAVGTGMLIAGAVHDHKHRWAVIAPKRNEFGIAYKF